MEEVVKLPDTTQNKRINTQKPDKNRPKHLIKNVIQNKKIHRILWKVYWKDLIPNIENRNEDLDYVIWLIEAKIAQILISNPIITVSELLETIYLIVSEVWLAIWNWIKNDYNFFINNWEKEEVRIEINQEKIKEELIDNFLLEVTLWGSNNNKNFDFYPSIERLLKNIWWEYQRYLPKIKNNLRNNSEIEWFVTDFILRIYKIEKYEDDFIEELLAIIWIKKYKLLFDLKSYNSLNDEKRMNY